MTTVGKKLVVLHRNHLPAMVNNSVLVNGQVLDLALPSVGLLAARAPPGSAGAFVRSGQVMWVRTVVSYGGAEPSRPCAGGHRWRGADQHPAGYHPQDVNLDGVVKYSGQGNDRDAILSTIGGTVPTTTRVSYAP